MSLSQINQTSELYKIAEISIKNLRKSPLAQRGTLGLSPTKNCNLTTRITVDFS